MSEPNESDILIHQIGTTIVENEKLAGLDWRGITLVYDTDDDDNAGMEGYFYTDDDWEAYPIKPVRDELYEGFHRLRELTQVEGLDKWKACRFQIRSPSMRMTYDLEYDDQRRWFVSGDDMGAKIESLRPE